MQITYDDVLLTPSYNHWLSRKEVDISMTSKCRKLTLQLPVMSSNMDTITGAEMADFMYCKGGIGVLHRFQSIDKNVEMLRKCIDAFVSVGCSDHEFDRVKALFDAGAGSFCVDVAHAHAKYVGKMLENMRAYLGDDVCIMAGNVATYAGADYLASCGADIIKVGIGGGSVCTTRLKTGFGVANLTAIKNCSRVNRSIVADGGIRYPGDVVKALAFGADFVMIGGMLAGTEPTPGSVFGLDTTKTKHYRGMASKEVQSDVYSGMSSWKTDEGVTTDVPYRTDQDSIIADIEGGLRSGLTYSGAINIRELQRKLEYDIISQAAKTEGLPHKTLEG